MFKEGDVVVCIKGRIKTDFDELVLHKKYVIGELQCDPNYVDYYPIIGTNYFITKDKLHLFFKLLTEFRKEKIKKNIRKNKIKYVLDNGHN